jgi:hypothetical protein
MHTGDNRGGENAVNWWILIIALYTIALLVWVQHLMVTMTRHKREMDKWTRRVARDLHWMVDKMAEHQAEIDCLKDLQSHDSERYPMEGRRTH